MQPEQIAFHRIWEYILESHLIVLMYSSSSRALHVAVVLPVQTQSVS